MSIKETIVQRLNEGAEADKASKKIESLQKKHGVLKRLHVEDSYTSRNGSVNHIHAHFADGSSHPVVKSSLFKHVSKDGQRYHPTERELGKRHGLTNHPYSASGREGSEKNDNWALKDLHAQVHNDLDKSKKSAKA